MTRAFVALLLDEATRASVGAEIDRLRPLSRAVAWVPTANLHLTLLDKVGVRLDSFADSKGKVDELFEPLSV